MLKNMLNMRMSLHRSLGEMSSDDTYSEIWDADIEVFSKGQMRAAPSFADNGLKQCLSSSLGMLSDILQSQLIVRKNMIGEVYTHCKLLKS